MLTFFGGRGMRVGSVKQNLLAKIDFSKSIGKELHSNKISKDITEQTMQNTKYFFESSVNESVNTEAISFHLMLLLECGTKI